MSTEKKLKATHFRESGGDVRWCAILESSAYWCDFRLVEAIGWELDLSAVYWGVSLPGERDPERAEPCLTGFIKWDGCMEIDFKETHFCDGPESFAALHETVQWMLGKCHELMLSAGGGGLLWEPRPSPGSDTAAPPGDASGSPADAADNVSGSRESDRSI